MARRSPDAVAAAAERLVEQLAADPAFVAHVADAEIERRVAAGDLVRVQQLAAGMVLVPAARPVELESLVGALVDVVLAARYDFGGGVDTLVRAAAAAIGRDLDTELGIEVAEEPEPEPEPVSDSESSKVTEPAPPAPVVVDAEPEPEAKDEGRRKPAGMPEPDDDSPCEQCGQPCAGDGQALKSWIRHRVKLCAGCFPTYGQRAS